MSNNKMPEELMDILNLAISGMDLDDAPASLQFMQKDVQRRTLQKMLKNHIVNDDLSDKQFKRMTKSLNCYVEVLKEIIEEVDE